VAHAVADSTDEFVELDEGGATKPARKKARAPARKVTVKQKAAPAAVAEEAPAAEAAAAGDEVAAADKPDAE
jgi:hypothetical protein